MNEYGIPDGRDGATTARSIAADAQGQLIDHLIEDPEVRLRAEFSRKEWDRLVFLRWCYQTGRLTEWPEGWTDGWPEGWAA